MMSSENGSMALQLSPAVPDPTQAQSDWNNTHTPPCTSVIEEARMIQVEGIMKSEIDRPVGPMVMEGHKFWYGQIEAGRVTTP